MFELLFERNDTIRTTDIIVARVTEGAEPVMNIKQSRPAIVRTDLVYMPKRPKNKIS